ncbi:acyl-CoA dehydrogenase [Amycolatopsis sp. VS8301801F10]|uniref:acyl-CoA dehydrogenase n=1 Tax=Amycolatopsis sp. VS8301801F10 TaxID=2652442 RepID=UPI0038FC93C9
MNRVQPVPLGDPHDPANPVGFAEVLAADERRELLEAGEALLDDWGFNSELVPAELGGRWQGTDELIRRIRPVFGRDVSLGLGYGVTSLMAAVNVWTAGSAKQRHELAGLLLGGAKVAIAYHELSRGNDFLHNDFRAEARAGRLWLDGTKQVINNVERADALVLFARTDDRPGGRSHSTLLVDKQQLSAGGIRYLPRFRTSGVRGCLLGGFVADVCPVPASSVVGDIGSGAETALRSFQVTRTVLPGMAVGVLETALREVTRFAGGRRLYGTTVSGLPHARAVLATAYTDFLIADCFSMTAARALHIVPEQAVTHASAVKYFVPLMIERALRDLSVVLGARGYLREGQHAIFGKHLRDIPVMSLGHASGTTCLLTLLPQLSTLARRGWRAEAAPAGLFDETPLNPLDFGRLRIATCGQDALAAALLAASASANADAGSIPALIGELAGHLRDLGDRCARLSPRQAGPDAEPEVFRLAERYCLLVAAASCIGVWQARAAAGALGVFGGGTAIRAALVRLRGLLSGDRRLLPAGVAEPLFTDLVRRTEDGTTLTIGREQADG